MGNKNNSEGDSHKRSDEHILIKEFIFIILRMTKELKYKY